MGERSPSSNDGTVRRDKDLQWIQVPVADNWMDPTAFFQRIEGGHSCGCHCNGKQVVFDGNDSLDIHIGSSSRADGGHLVNKKEVPVLSSMLFNFTVGNVVVLNLKRTRK